jgi:hypothetical protein
VVEFARALVVGYRARDRMARVAAAFGFVNHLVSSPPPAEGECRDGVDVLLALAGEQEGPAVILTALLQALGERASVDYAPGMAFVRVEIRVEDLARLPPWSNLMVASSGRYYIPLDARRPRGPLALLPRLVRAAMLRLGPAGRS